MNMYLVQLCFVENDESFGVMRTHTIYARSKWEALGKAIKVNGKESMPLRDFDVYTCFQNDMESE